MHTIRTTWRMLVQSRPAERRASHHLQFVDPHQSACRLLLCWPAVAYVLRGISCLAQSGATFCIPQSSERPAAMPLQMMSAEKGHLHVKPA